VNDVPIIGQKLAIINTESWKVISCLVSVNAFKKQNTNFFYYNQDFFCILMVIGQLLWEKG